jgi:hypothetical protein
MESRPTVSEPSLFLKHLPFNYMVRLGPEESFIVCLDNFHETKPHSRMWSLPAAAQKLKSAPHISEITGEDYL